MAINRDPAGTPTGGRFAPSTHAEGDVELDVDVYVTEAALTEPAAHMYRADIYTPRGLIERLIRYRLASPAGRDMSVEEVLDQVAKANVIDRYDESSFDSDEFPKVVFKDQMCDGDTIVGPDGVNHLVWGARVAEDGGDERELCSSCGQPVEGGEGWNGECGPCADRTAVASEPDNNEGHLDQ